MLPDGKTILTALWAPVLAGTLATAATWLVWDYTAIPCTTGNPVALMCGPGLSKYISTIVLLHCIINASIAVTIVGGSDLMLFLRERHRNNQMMDIMKTFLDEVIEQRRQEVEQRREEAEARREADARAAEERRQAAAERQAFLEALNRLTEAIGQNGRDRQ